MFVVANFNVRMVFLKHQKVLQCYNGENIATGSDEYLLKLLRHFLQATIQPKICLSTNTKSRFPVLQQFFLLLYIFIIKA